MLQIALGGYDVITDGVSESTFVDSDNNVFLEPGFTIMFPASIDSAKADVVYLLIRKRSDSTGNNFSSIGSDDYFVSVTDATTGENLDSTLVLNSGGDLVNSDWNTSSYTPLVLSVEPFSSDDEDRQVRLIDVQVTDASTKAFISARLNVSSSSSPFSYLIIDNAQVQSRSKKPNFGTTAIMTAPATGSYILLSPLSTFEESTKEDSDFSYPTGQIYYKTEKTFNRESFDFSISDRSHPVVENNIKILPLPGFPSIGVLMLDGYLAKDLKGSEGLTYVDIDAIGKVSGQIDTFRIYFARSENIYVI